MTSRCPWLWGVALMLAACGAGPRAASVPSDNPASSAKREGCPGEGKRLLSTIEQRESGRAAVARTAKHHDRRGQLTRVERDGDGDGVAEQVDRYTYDEEGHLIAFENGEVVESYRLDRSGRVAVRERQRRGSPIGTSVIVTYDAKGRVIREVSDLEDVRYGHDITGREVREERFRPGEDVAYLSLVTTSDAAGRPLLQQGHDPNGPLHKTWRYDERGRELESEWVRDGSLLLRTKTRYDAAGRRVLEEQLNSEGALVGRESWTYDSHGEEASHRTESMESNDWVEERYTYTAPMKCPR